MAQVDDPNTILVRQIAYPGFLKNGIDIESVITTGVGLPDNDAIGIVLQYPDDRFHTLRVGHHPLAVDRKGKVWLDENGVALLQPGAQIVPIEGLAQDRVVARIEYMKENIRWRSAHWACTRSKIFISVP